MLNVKKNVNKEVKNILLKKLHNFSITRDPDILKLYFFYKLHVGNLFNSPLIMIFYYSWNVQLSQNYLSLQTIII